MVSPVLQGWKARLAFNARAMDSFRNGDEVSIRTAFHATAGMITNGAANFRFWDFCDFARGVQRVGICADCGHRTRAALAPLIEDTPSALPPTLAARLGLTTPLILRARMAR